MTRGDAEAGAMLVLAPVVLVVAVAMWAVDALRVRLRGW